MAHLANIADGEAAVQRLAEGQGIVAEVARVEFEVLGWVSGAGRGKAAVIAVICTMPRRRLTQLWNAATPGITTGNVDSVRWPHANLTACSTLS